MVGFCGNNGDVGFMQSGVNHAYFNFPTTDITFAFGMNDNSLIVGCDNDTSFFGTVTGGFYPFVVAGAAQTGASPRGDHLPFSGPRRRRGGGTP